MHKTLNFCPTSNQYNRLNFNKDINRFTRHLKFRAHFGIDSEDKEITEEDLFGIKEKSNWTPKYVDRTVETFVAAIKRDFENSTLKKQPKDNLTLGERKALHDLQMRDNIIITKADRGSATVVWDVKDYLKEAEKQLNNQTFYKKLETCPTEEHTRRIQSTLDEFVHNGDISEV